MEKLRTGVIGTGYLGKFHAEKYARMNGVDLVGVVDSDFSRARQVADEWGARAFSDYRDLFGQVDAVSVVVPTQAHFEVSRAFLENGIHVLIEKPITTTLEEADQLISLAEARDLIIQVGHLERFNPAVVAVRDFIKRPMFIESNRLSTFKDRGTDVSVVLDLMIHDIDIILNFVDSEVKSIHASGTPAITSEVDIANARLEFQNGCVANVTASRVSMKNQRKFRMFQKNQYVSVDFANNEITIIEPNSASQNAIIPGMGVKQLCFTKGDALQAELMSFVETVRNRSVPEVSGQMGRDALKIALNIMAQIHHAIDAYADA